MPQNRPCTRRFGFPLPALLLAALAAGPATAPDGPATAVPSDGNYRAHRAWNTDCEARVAAFQGKPCDVIFIGDSITANFVGTPTKAWPLVGRSVWDKYYADRNALDFGVGADGTQHVLWRLAHMGVGALRPRVAVILIGINDNKFSADDINAGQRAVLDATRRTFPGVKVILVSVLPSNRGNDKYESVNRGLRAMADDRSVFYLDVFAQMPPVGDNFKGVGRDHVHLTPEGYEIWAATMEPLMKRLLADRP